MYSTETYQRSMELKLRSDLAFIHSAVRKAEKFAQECGADGVSTISVVLRELLANAVAHGNHNAPDLKVDLHIEYDGEGAFRITVEDEGEGFDYSCLDTRIPEDPRNIHNRGYMLIRNMCRSVEFNERGNRVTVLLDMAGRSYPGQSRS